MSISRPIKIPFMNNNSDIDSESESEDIIKIDVRRLKNTNYDIILSECHFKSNNYSTYTCIDIINKNKYMIDIYKYNITNIDFKINQIMQISNKNIIKIYDIINFKSEIYIIRDFYIKDKIYNYLNKTNEENLLNYKILLDVIKYLLDLQIELDIIKIDNIYDDSILILNPIFKFLNTNNNIIYGSPVYSSPKMFNSTIKNDNIVWNLGLILYQIIYKIDLFELYNNKFIKLFDNDIKNLIIENINIKFIILKMIDLDNMFTFNNVYLYFQSNKNIKEKDSINSINSESDNSDDYKDIFDIEL